MKLLSNNKYRTVEELLRTYGYCAIMEEPYKSAMTEIIEFFDIPLYRDLLDIFYLHRNNYKNRYPTNAIIFSYLSKKLNLQESTLYLMRKEIIYKSAMVFYKYNLI